MSTQRTHVITPAVASAASVHAAITLTTVPQTVTTAITSPDVCRVLTITGNAAGMAGTVSFVFTDQNLDAAADSIALNGTATVLGVAPCGVLTSITLPARTHAGDTVSIGVGDVFGLPGHIGMAGDVTLAERMAAGATAYTAEAVGTVDSDSGTVAAVIVAGDTLRWTYLDRGASGSLLAELRDMIAEPTTTTYSDDDLLAVIERYPLIDSDDYEPDDLEWTPAYDLNAAAANIWGRKAAACVGLYDFTADGGTFHRSQMAKDMRAQARYYNARRAPSSIKSHVDHRFERDYQSTYWEDGTGTPDMSYVVNAPEDDDE
jgi:hypothetical protein